MKHIHAELMMEYAKDAMETDMPWEKWEYSDGLGCWYPVRNTGPAWDSDNQYRRKPQTININGHEVPEPYRGEMFNGTFYYVPSVSGPYDYVESVWHDHVYDINIKKKGLLHINKESARIHAQALISFTEA
jgi:hypothetical protein